MADNRICILSGIYPPDSGGPANFALTFSKFLLENDLCVSVLTYTDGKTFDFCDGNIRVKAFSRHHPVIIRYFQLVFEILREVRAGSQIIANGCFIEVRIARIFYRFNYVTKVPGDIVWERARAQGLTSSNIDEYQLEKGPFLYKLFRKFYTQSLRKSKTVIVPSRHLRLLCESWGILKNNIRVVGNAVDTNMFQADNEIEKEYDFVTVCRLVPWKGVGQLIYCAKELNASLLIIGEGPDRSYLESLITPTEDKIVFAGDLSRDQVLLSLRKSNVFVLNSNFEATSYALLEAMACGLPGIANENTGSEEIITHGVDGLLCGPKSGLELSRAMIELYNSPERARALGNAAIAKVQSRFAIQKNFPEILDLIEND